MKAFTLLHIIGFLSMNTLKAVAVESNPLSDRLQELIDKLTRKYSQDGVTGTSLSLGVSLPEPGLLGSAASRGLPTGAISLGSGPRQKPTPGENAAACLGGRRSETCVQPSDGFAMGSTAKMYTAAAVLRLVDQGKFGLDDRALPLFDALWTRLNGTSIVNGLGPKIKEVTVRHLLGMQSGIPDFDASTTVSRQYQYAHPDEDLGPVKEISFIFPLKNWSCDPGTCVEYSSSNYELLGLLLAQQAGKKSWDEYTQAQDLPSIPEMTSTIFGLHGKCSNYTNVHAYSTAPGYLVDVYNWSCTNGWTCGNLISSAADAAVFVRALLGKGERVVKKSTQEEMLKFVPLNKTWAIGLPYGLGLMDVGWGAQLEPGAFVGHCGDTYGFNSITGYVKEHDFSLSVVANSENANITNDAAAQAYEIIVDYLNHQGSSTLIV